ncbi:MAG: hypothetical protein ACTSYI_00055 [Promethearchaeota archaeon]
MSHPQHQNKARIAVIANFPNKASERAEMYFQHVFEPFGDTITWEYISYKDLLNETNFNRAKSMDGLILSSSNFIISDPVVQEKMLVEMFLVREFAGPIYGMCYGHHLLEFMYGAAVTEQDPNDFFNNQNVQFGSKVSDQSDPPNISNSPKLMEVQFAPVIEKNFGTIINHPSDIEYVPLFKDDFNIQNPPSSCKIYSKQHKKLPIYGVDFRMDENSSEDTFRAAIVILQKFLRHFFIPTPN